MRGASVRALACAVGLVLVAAACGGEGGDDSAPAVETSELTTPATVTAEVTTPEVTTRDAPDVSAAEASVVSRPPASGEPILIMQIVVDSPELGLAIPEAQAAVEGRIARLNADGGVAGRPVAVDVCQAGFDPNVANECAQAAVQGGYLAVVSSSIASGGDYHDILNNAGIPEIGYLGFVPKDGENPLGFMVSQGAQGPVMAAAHRVAQDFSPETVAVMHTDSPGGVQSLVDASTVLESLGIAVTPVPIPRNQPDLSAQVQTAMRADAVLNIATGADLAKIVLGLVQAGYEQHVLLSGAVLPALADALGPALDGVKSVTQWATPEMQTEGYEQHLMDIASVDDSLDSTAAGLEAWAGADLFARAALIAEDATPAALIAALSTITDYDAGGAATPMDFSQPGTVIEGQPAIRRNTAIACTFHGPVCEADTGDWYDAWTGVPIDR